MTAPPPLLTRGRRHRGASLRTGLLYARVIVYEFRWTLLLLAAAASVGTALFATQPVDNGRYPGFGRALFGAWMALLAQPVFVPGPWYVGLIDAIYSLLGFVLVGEGIVRFGLLMVSRRRGETEWMTVMASTYRDHIILAGLGHLGYRIFEHLHGSGVNVVVMEMDENGPFVAAAKAAGVPVLIRDMREDQSLLDAGIERARAIVIATNADMANIEVAIDARRMNPSIRVLMRLYDQRIAQKLSGALDVDAAFSSSALAAPVVAAMSLDAKVLSSLVIGGVSHVVCEVRVAQNSTLAGKRVDQLEMGYTLRVLARVPADGPTQSAPAPATTIAAGDTLVIHTAASQLATLAAAGCGASS